MKQSFVAVCFVGIYFSIAHGATTYQIIPVHMHRDYLVSGFVTTDGTIGKLALENILDYQIEVAGRYGHIFLPNQLDSALVLDELYASPTGLRLAHNDPPRAFLGATAADGASFSCVECLQDMIWSVGTNHNTGESGRVVSYEVFGENNFPGVSAFYSKVSAEDFVIAELVPEPTSTHALSFWFLLIGLRYRTRKTARANGQRN